MNKPIMLLETGCTQLVKLLPKKILLSLIKQEKIVKDTL